MRFGVCCSLDQAPTVMSAGFDYVELPAGQLFGGPSEPPWEKLEGLPVEATNLFIAGDLKIVGPDQGETRAYAELVIPRAALAGVSTMVIGSGTARKAPAGYDLDAAEDDFIHFAAMCGMIAREYGITIAPESLVPAETNVGNYLGDLARMLHYKGVAYTADSYHVLNQPGALPEESFFWANELPHAPAHVHLGDQPRNWPKADDPNLAGFVDRLVALGYDGRVSLECKWEDMEQELPLALDQAKRLFRLA
jgi:sugar phosphate isomerase/epimerase